MVQSRRGWNSDRKAEQTAREDKSVNTREDLKRGNGNDMSGHMSRKLAAMLPGGVGLGPFITAKEFQLKVRWNFCASPTCLALTIDNKVSKE